MAGATFTLTNLGSLGTDISRDRQLAGGGHPGRRRARHEPALIEREV